MCGPDHSRLPTNIHFDDVIFFWIVSLLQQTICGKVGRITRLLSTEYSYSYTILYVYIILWRLNMIWINVLLILILEIIYHIHILITVSWSLENYLWKFHLWRELEITSEFLILLDTHRKYVGHNLINVSFQHRYLIKNTIYKVPIIFPRSFQFVMTFFKIEV